MSRIDHIQNLYFIGIGGIGMSALARYFKAEGKTVAGYDKTETELTRALVREGIEVLYDDDIDEIPEVFKNDKKALDCLHSGYSEASPAIQLFSSESLPGDEKSCGSWIGYRKQTHPCGCGYSWQDNYYGHSCSYPEGNWS